MKKYLLLFCFIFLGCTTLSLFADESSSESCSPHLNLDVPPLKQSPEDILKSFQRWLVKTTKKVESRSQVIETAYGPIEYVIKGCGPVVLCLHGGFGGYDQGLLIGSHLIKQGFTVLAPSRPGYLLTPLSVGQTNAQQADAMIGLLDALEIPQAFVLGFSAGAPVAFECAIRHPERVKGLVLECIGSQPDQSALYALFVEILKLNGVADFGSWLLYLATKYHPFSTGQFVLSLDNTLSPKAEQRREKYVFSHLDQFAFLQQIIYTTMPLGPRSQGIINDINNLDSWPTFPYSLLKAPTIIIEARADSNGSYPEAVWVASQIPGVQFVTVEESGHFIWLGRFTRQWERQLGNFLHSLSPKCRDECSH